MYQDTIEVATPKALQKLAKAYKKRQPKQPVIVAGANVEEPQLKRIAIQVAKPASNTPYRDNVAACISPFTGAPLDPDTSPQYIKWDSEKRGKSTIPAPNSFKHGFGRNLDAILINQTTTRPAENYPTMPNLVARYPGLAMQETIKSDSYRMATGGKAGFKTSSILHYGEEMGLKFNPNQPFYGRGNLLYGKETTISKTGYDNFIGTAACAADLLLNVQTPSWFWDSFGGLVVPHSLAVQNLDFASRFARLLEIRLKQPVKIYILEKEELKDIAKAYVAEDAYDWHFTEEEKQNGKSQEVLEQTIVKNTGRWFSCYANGLYEELTDKKLRAKRFTSKEIAFCVIKACAERALKQIEQSEERNEPFSLTRPGFPREARNYIAKPWLKWNRLIPKNKNMIFTDENLDTGKNLRIVSELMTKHSPKAFLSSAICMDMQRKNVLNVSELPKGQTPCTGAYLSELKRQVRQGKFPECQPAKRRTGTVEIAGTK